MSAQSTPAVLHITSAVGGGVDRYIRDIAATTRRRHHVLHVGREVDVLEDVATGSFFPLRFDAGIDASREALEGWIRSTGIGIVHAHSLDRDCRLRLHTLVRERAIPYVVTLHDLTFVRPTAFEEERMPDPDWEWIATVAPTLERAAVVITPSEFILDLVLACVTGVRTVVIAPGIRAPSRSDALQPPATFAQGAPPHVVAVVGAVGAHKGSSVVQGVANKLGGSDIGIVVIGYTDTVRAQGWVVPGNLYIHGPYLDNTITDLLHAYRVETVLFPNRLPESFSYTLSEVWAAGIPVIVPGEGALGERVERHGGGWLLPPGFDDSEAAALLVWLTTAQGAEEHGRVKLQIAQGDTLRIPPLEAMTREIEALYERFAIPIAHAPNDESARAALNSLFAANLNGFEFRKELLGLATELAQSRARSKKLEQDLDGMAKETAAWVAKLEQNTASWIAKLEGDIALLKQSIEKLEAENRVLADQKAAFDRLPETMRKYLIKRAFRERG
jgi:glycosyltransferase involved in cell wall biosynthesis